MRNLYSGILSSILLIGLPVPLLAQEPIKIGAILSLTGAGAFWGTNARDGMLLALKEVNASGGINGRKLEVVLEDEKCDPMVSVTALQKLSEIDNINVVIGTACSSGTMAIAPIAERKKILLLSPCAEADPVSQAGDYIFRMWTPSGLQSQVMAQYAREALKLDTIAVLSIQNEFGKSLSEKFIEAFEKLGGKIVYSEEYHTDSQDVRPLLTLVRAKKAQALYLASYISDGIMVLKQFYSLGLRIPTLITSGLDSPDFLESLGPNAEGTIISNLPDTTSAEFRQRFADEYHREWPGIVSCAPFGYEALKVLAQGLRTVGADPNKLKEYLYGLKDFPGVAGTINFDKNGDVLRPHQIFIVKNGKKVPVMPPAAQVH